MLAEYTRINDDDVDLAQTKVADLMVTSVMTTIVIMASVMMTIVITTIVMTTIVITTSAMMNRTYNAGSEFKFKSFSQRTLELLTNLRRRRRNTGRTRQI